MADDVNLVVPQVRTERIELANEVRDVEHRGVGDLVRLSATELIVADDGAVRVQSLERLQVDTAEPRASVQKNRRRCGSRTRDLVPDAATVYREAALSGWKGVGYRGRRRVGRGWSFLGGAGETKNEDSDIRNH